MGIEIIFAGLTALAGLVGGVAQSNAANKAADEQREANSVQAAQQQAASANSRRERIREERIRRAQIVAGAENQGTSGSSGAVGAVGALSSNLAGLIGTSLGESKANTAINTRLQNAADQTAKGNMIGAWTNTIQQGLSGFRSVFDRPPT